MFTPENINRARENLGLSNAAQKRLSDFLVSLEYSGNNECLDKSQIAKRIATLPFLACNLFPSSRYHPDITKPKIDQKGNIWRVFPGKDRTMMTVVKNLTGALTASFFFVGIDELRVNRALLVGPDGNYLVSFMGIGNQTFITTPSK